MNIVRSTDAAFAGMWSQLFSEDSVQNPLLTPMDVEYQREYSRDTRFEDLSFIVEEKNVPMMGVCAALGEHSNGTKSISGFGRSILFLESQKLDAFQRDGAGGVIREELQKILQAHPNVPVSFSEPRAVLSPVARLLLDSGAKATARFTQLVDLTVPEAQLRGRIRKSYKSLINWGAKNLKLQLFDHANVAAEAMEKFRQLHIEVAGRETRSQRSWELQLEMIRKQEAFAILGDLDGALVTAALFLHSKRYCLYGVSASKRELFEKPLGHIVLWSAIEHAKKIGCSVFELGEQLFPGHSDPPPTPKELNISGFKKGFGGETRIVTEIRLAAKN